MTGGHPGPKVRFEIEPVGKQAKLIVVHDGSEAGSAMLENVSGAARGLA